MKTEKQYLEKIKSLESKLEAMERLHEELMQSEEELQVSNQQLIENEHKLIEQEALLNKVGKIAKIGGWEMDMLNEGKAIWTKATYDIVEIDYGDPVPGFDEHISWYLPEYQNMVKQTMNEFAEKHNPIQFEAPFKTKTGKIKWGRTIGEADIVDGKCIKLRGTFQDITEQKKAEEELKQSEKKFKNYIENAPDGVFVVNEKAQYIEVNTAACKITGYTAEELLSKKATDLLPQSDQGKGLAHFREVQEKGIATVELGLVKKGGEIRTWEINAVKLSETRYLGFAKDITNIKLAQTDLKQSEEKFRTLVEQAADGLLFHDTKGNIQDVNQAATTQYGYSREELLQMNVRDIAPDYNIRDNKGEFYRKMKFNSAVRFETRQRRNNGEIFPVEVALTKISLNNKTYIMGLCRDISLQKKKETQLREQAQLLNKIGEIGNVGGWELDVDTLKTIWTDEVYKIHELTRDNELFVEDTIKFYTPEDQPIISKAIEECMKNSKPFTLELAFVTATGKRLWVKTTGEAEIKNDKVTKVYGTFQDITERRLADEKLKHSEKKYKGLYQSINEGVCLHELIYNDKGQPVDYKILDVNPKYEHILGLKKEKVINSIASELYPDDHPPYLEEYAQVAVTGQPINFETFHDGFNKFFQISVFSPKKHQFATIFQDITKRKNAEIKLRESESKFRTIFDQSPIGIELYGSDGQQIDANKASLDMFGIPDISEIKHFNLFDGTSLDDEKKAKLRDGQMVSYQAVFDFKRVKSLGQYKTNKSCKADFDYVVSPLTSNKNLIGYLVMVQDVSDQKRIESELIQAKEKAEESDRLKSAFLANMSHEIRTPMNGILGFAELLKEQNLSESNKLRFIGIIEKSGERMLNIINDLIDISKIEAGQMEVAISETNIREQIEYLGTFFRPEAERKGLKLVSQIPSKDQKTIIKTDREKVYAVVTNLLKNAIKYTPEGSIEFGFEPVVMPDKKPGVKIFVRDTGIGIPANRQKAIFERFIQADIEDKSAMEGAGLGLAISSAYAEMLGGNISVESEEGVGSTFSLTIPDLDSKVTVDPDENNITPKKSKEDINKLKVLIVEDDEFSLLHLKTLMRNMAHEILTETSGRKAVETCKSNPDIDLILMDIKLPGMDGYSATREIRLFNTGAFIIAQTAYALTGDREKALEAGCNEYLAKPIKKKDLMNIISGYLASNQ